VRIGVTLGTARERDVTARLPHAHIERYPRNDQTIMAFQSRHVDAFSLYHPALVLRQHHMHTGNVVLPGPIRASTTSAGVRARPIRHGATGLDWRWISITSRGRLRVSTRRSCGHAASIRVRRWRWCGRCGGRRRGECGDENHDRNYAGSNMDLNFESVQADAYTSGLQRARVLTEHWVAGQIYCPNCGNFQITRYHNNNPVGDFHCSVCREDYELKGQRARFGAKVVDGAYRAMIHRLSGSSNPNLFLLNYDVKSLCVTNLIIIPKHFFTAEIIEERKPLPSTARRAGWVGCRILLDGIPQAGRIPIIRNGVIEPKADVLAKWQRTLFLRDSETWKRRAGWSV
jgi:type II restriction enzyme